jgi:hypothetical protein
MSSSKRHFTAVVNSKENGLYISSSPSSAARKIVSKLCSASKSKKVEFCVREITQGSKKKTYGPYLGEMKKLAKPIKLKGRIIRYESEVYLKKKSSTVKVLKKIRGGDIRWTDKLTSVDFEVCTTEFQCPYKLINLSDYGLAPVAFGMQTFGYLLNIHDLMNYFNNVYNIPPNCLLIKNEQTNKQYIFFKKEINNFNKNNILLIKEKEIF